MRGGRRPEFEKTGLDTLLVVAGLVALFLGGESLVRGSVAIAQRLAIPPLLIGLTVVGFGTSMPELLVSLDAARRGAPDIALGNVIGSNIANVLLIVGVASLLWPIRPQGVTLRRDLLVMLAASLAVLPPFANGRLGRPGGALLVAALLGYLAWAYICRGPEDRDDSGPPPRGLLVSLPWVVGGITALLLGARWLVDGAVSIARGHGVSEAFIGLTIVAVGTSLPELATSVVAALRRQSDIAIGNVVGSNIFNVLGILGATAVVEPIPVGRRFATFDLPVMIGVSLMLTALLWTRPVLGRLTGGFFLLVYAGFVWSA